MSAELLGEVELIAGAAVMNAVEGELRLAEIGGMGGSDVADERGGIAGSCIIGAEVFGEGAGEVVWPAPAFWAVPVASIKGVEATLEAGAFTKRSAIRSVAALPF